MENFTKRWKWSISIVAIGLITMYGCTDVVMMEELKDSQESFDRNAPINFSGCVIDPLSCRPVANATVTSGATTVTTDSDGKFQTSVEESLLSNSVSVSKDGHVPFSFIVDYNRFKGDIRIDLPRRQQCVWIGPDEGAWYKVSTYNNCLTYIIDIFTGSVKNWTEVCIGPGGNAYGAGIDIFFGLASISVAGPNGEHIEFSKRIDVRYSTEDLLGVAEKSDCLAEEYSFNPDQDGEVIVFSTISGTVIPGVGIISIDASGGIVFYPFLEDGSVGDPMTVGDGGDIPNVPHQSVADGNG